MTRDVAIWGTPYLIIQWLTGITNNSVSFSISYDNDGRRSTLTYPNNTYATYTYDYSSNLTRVWHRTQGGTTLADINYTYDYVNNRLTRTDTQTATYTYDYVYRLLQSTLGETYTYDYVGNRLTGPGVSDVLSYDNGNELQNLNSITYTYDYNGNRTQKVDGNTTTTYTYDDENRLTGVTISGNPNTVITYAYDPLGRRVQKNVNGTITNYVYDKDAIILAYDQSGTVQTRYTHGLNIDEPLAMDNTSQVYYYHADGLGSIAALTNASQSVVQSYAYDTFGNITNGTPTIRQPYTYTAREYDPETGLYFYRARYYDSKAGRFLQRDPIGFGGGGVNLYGYADSVGKPPIIENLYSYAGNNPVTYIDPYGLFWWDTAKAGGKGGLAAVGPGEMIGTIAGGIAGAGLGLATNIPGAPYVFGYAGGTLGGWMGSWFDPEGAGQLNYKEPIPLIPSISVPRPKVEPCQR